MQPHPRLQDDQGAAWQLPVILVTAVGQSEAVMLSVRPEDCLKEFTSLCLIPSPA